MRSSVTVRAWELAVLGGFGIFAFAVLKPRPEGSPAPNNWLELFSGLFPIAGPILV